MNAKKFTKIFCGAAIFAALTFSGCGGSDAADKTDQPNQPSKTAHTEAAPTTQHDSKISDARNTPAVRVAKTVGPTVVGITNKAIVRDFFNRTFEAEAGTGSGVIFKKNGYIVTNDHVISGAKEIIVSLPDGRSLNGTLVGTDEMTDIAVVKIEADDLPTASFGNSDEVEVGEPAIVIGNPMGLEYQGSVTVGVISALNRTIKLNDGSVKLLQTDAAINFGNSGGALANADGEIIGINSSKLAGSGIEGMGFAIPINTVKKVVEELIDKGYVARPYMGVTILDKESAARMGFQLTLEKGIYVYQVSLNSPAGRAGFQRGDIILTLDGKTINSFADLRNEINAHKIGDKVKVTYDRDGKEETVEITLEEMPQPSN